MTINEISPVQLWLFTVFPLILQIHCHLHCSWILKYAPERFQMYRNDIDPAKAEDRRDIKLQQPFIWLCLIMVVVFAILKLFSGNMDVFFCETYACRAAFVNAILTIVGGMFFELTEAQMNLALWRYHWCRPETTAWEKSSITSVGGTMIICYNFFHTIRVTLTLAYLIDNVKKAAGGTQPAFEPALYVAVGGGCLFEVLALFVSGKISWQTTENTYKVMYSDEEDLTEHRKKFTEKEITGDWTHNPETEMVL
jgi:hypothetical protein